MRAQSNSNHRQYQRYERQPCRCTQTRMVLPWRVGTDTFGDEVKEDEVECECNEYEDEREGHCASHEDCMDTRVVERSATPLEDTDK